MAQARTCEKSVSRRSTEIFCALLAVKYEQKAHSNTHSYVNKHENMFQKAERNCQNDHKRCLLIIGLKLWSSCWPMVTHALG